MLRIVVVAGTILVAATSAKAENLHLRQQGQWSCGYITYTDPNYLICKGCEDQGDHFDSGGFCITRGEDEPLKQKLRKRHMDRMEDAAAARKAKEAADELPGPPVDTPDYGKSGVSSRHGGTIRGDGVFSRGMGLNEAEVLRDLVEVRRTVEPILRHLRAGDYAAALDLISSHEKRMALADGSRRSEGHLDWLLKATMVAVEHDAVKEALQSLRTGNASIKEADDQINAMLARHEKHYDALLKIGSNSPVAFQGERQQYRLMREFHKLHMRHIAEKAAIAITVAQKPPEWRKKECEQREGVWRKDLQIKGETEPVWACNVKPIAREEITIFFRDYDNYLKSQLETKN